MLRFIFGAAGAAVLSAPRFASAMSPKQWASSSAVTEIDYGAPGAIEKIKAHNAFKVSARYPFMSK